MACVSWGWYSSTQKRLCSALWRACRWCPKCGLVIAYHLSALKGRPSKAQANGLGGEPVFLRVEP